VTRPPTERPVVLVLDVQNEYCDAAGALGRAGRDLSHVQAAVARLIPFFDTVRRAQVPVVWVRTEECWTPTSRA
jgi:ureidoacrylate peracid hydrolase